MCTVRVHRSQPRSSTEAKASCASRVPAVVTFSTVLCRPLLPAAEIAAGRLCATAVLLVCVRIRSSQHTCPQVAVARRLNCASRRAFSLSLPQRPLCLCMPCISCIPWPYPCSSHSMVPSVRNMNTHAAHMIFLVSLAVCPATLFSFTRCGAGSPAWLPCFSFGVPRSCRRPFNVYLVFALSLFSLLHTLRPRDTLLGRQPP